MTILGGVKMKVKYCNKTFAEIQNGGTFICSSNSETIVMKISPCKEDGRDKNAVRLDDGKLFHFDETENVYPVNCFVMRSV